ncbi:MAG: hypothetical protein PHI32_11615 [Dysgonamonadaceae bacterium]|nr:hypothetical protein [Dysgonamonadaceae bacterium]
MRKAMIGDVMMVVGGRVDGWSGRVKSGKFVKWKVCKVKSGKW